MINNIIEDIRTIKSFAHLRIKKKKELPILLVVHALEKGTNILQPLLWGMLIESIAENKFDNTALFISYIAGTYILIIFLVYLEEKLTIEISSHIAKDIKNGVFENCIDYPMKKIDEMDTGEFIYRIEGDADSISNFFCNQQVEIVMQIITILILGILVFNISWEIAIIPIIGFMVSMLTLIFISRFIKTATIDNKKHTDDYYSFMEETLVCIKEIKLLGLCEKRIDGFVKLLGKSVGSEVLIGKLTALSRSVIMLFDFVIQIVVYVVGIIMIKNGELSLTLFIAIASYANMLSDSLLNVSRITPDIQDVIVSIERINSSIKTGVLDDDGIEYEEKIREIELENVSFKYEDSETILDNACLSINEPGMYGIKGGNGNGKTTFFSLLSGLYKDYDGTIRLNKKELSTFSDKTLRKKIGVIVQEPLLFHDTLRENIRLWDEKIEDEHLLSACKDAGLIDLINDLPCGLDFEIQEGGRNLSIGEKKRVAIARALLRDYDILLLDEITTSLDTAYRSIILKTLNLVKDKKILISATHDTSELKACKRVYEIREKIIVEIDRT